MPIEVRRLRFSRVASGSGSPGSRIGPTETRTTPIAEEKWFMSRDTMSCARNGFAT